MPLAIRRHPWLAPALCGGVWLAAVAAAEAVKHFRGIEQSLCVFRRLTGVPCPTCGSTRALLALTHGELGAALIVNPLVATLLLIFPVALAVWALGGGRSLSRAFSRRWAWAVLLVFILANWAFVIWQHPHP